MAEPNEAAAPGPIRVLVADDHPVVREGLAALIGRQRDMAVVAEARDGQEAVALYAFHRPDVLLLDLQMPALGGVEALAQIRRRHPGACVLVLTTFDGEEDIYRALQAGARGYLLKDAGRERLLEAIRGVHGGTRWIPPDVAAKLADRMTGPELTGREQQVLELIVAGRSNAEIGAALAIAEGTVKAHVNSILAKLNVSDRTQAVTAALRRGLVHLG